MALHLPSTIRRIWYRFKHLPSRLAIEAGILLFILVAIPLVTWLVQQNQKLRSEATNEQSEELPVPRFPSNELLIKVKPEASKNLKPDNPADPGIAAVKKVHERHGVEKLERVIQTHDSENEASLSTWYKLTIKAPKENLMGNLVRVANKLEITLPDPKNNQAQPREQALNRLNEIIQELDSDPSIDAVQPNYELRITLGPNDPFYTSTGAWGQTYQDLWGIHKIGAPTAWDVTTGSPSVTVAVIDTGVDRNHSDLAGNMWVNSKETPSNNLDDDGNGYIDDYYGWDFINNDKDPMDDHGHGTHCAGTIAGVGNNSLGVVGVNWTSKIMPLKFLNSSGSGSSDGAMKALKYAADMGAQVTSNSWGGSGVDLALSDAIHYAYLKGSITVAAAGNNNGDALGFSPANDDHAITVAASAYNDTKASFSNWGEKLDVAAPGVDILSLRAAVNPMCTSDRTVAEKYCRVSGTSMATPHVSGLVALLISKNPLLTPEEIRQILRVSADDLGVAGKDKEFGFGRINAAKALGLANTHPLAPEIITPTSHTTITSTALLPIKVRIPGDNFTQYRLEIASASSPSTWTTLTTSNTQPLSDTIATSLNPLNYPDGLYNFRLTATDQSGKAYQAQAFNIKVNFFETTLNAPRDRLSPSTVAIIGTARTKNGATMRDYVLEWGVGSSPSTWSTSGITRTNNGTVPVTNGQLGTWNAATLSPNTTYTLRLTVNNTANQYVRTTSKITIDTEIVSGWPKVINHNSTGAITPLMADVNGDGLKEVIFGAYDGKLYVYKKDGTSLPGFPLTLGTNLGYGPNAADLNGDGKAEIIVNAMDASYISRIHVIQGDGTSLPGWVNPQLGTSNLARTTPSVADLNRDGTPELIAVEINTFVTETEILIKVFNRQGTLLPGFPKKYSLPSTGFGSGDLYPFGSYSPSSIVDLDHDGYPEIALAFGDRAYLFDNQGNILSGWPKTMPLFNGKIMQLGSSFSSGDIDGDRVYELVVTSTHACTPGAGYCYAGSTADSVLYAFEKNGTIPSGWPKTSSVDSYHSASSTTPYFAPVLADTDNDQKDEIIMAGYPFSIFDFEGKKTLTSPPNSTTQPAAMDVDGDGHLEFAFVSSISSGVILMKDTGTIFWQKPSSGVYYYAPIMLGDLDNNGAVEVLATAYTSSSTPGSTFVYLWELPKPAASPKYSWPMFNYSPNRSGRLPIFLPPTPPSPLPSPSLLPSPSPSPSPLRSPSPSPSIPPSPVPSPNPGDLTPPTVRILSPTAGSKLSKISTKFSVSASDGSGISQITLYVNTTLLKICQNTTTCQVQVKPSSLPSGTHSLRACATDNSVNRNTTNPCPSISVTK